MELGGKIIAFTVFIKKHKELATNELSYQLETLGIDNQETQREWEREEKAEMEMTAEMWTCSFKSLNNVSESQVQTAGCWELEDAGD